MITDNKVEITDEMYTEFYLAFERKYVERLLEKYSKPELKEKTALLKKIMRLEKSYGLDGSEYNDELEYEIRMATFLEGTWRVI